MPGTSPTRPVRRAAGWAVVALLLTLALGSIPRYQGWDTTYYLAQTSSLAEDGDLDLRNDLMHVQSVPTALHRHLTRTYANGAIINNRPLGPSLLWLPAYTASLPLRAAGAVPERWSLAQLAALQLFSMALMVWLLWVLDRWLRRLGVRRWLAALSALALVMGTPLLIYGFRGFRGSHLASAVAVTWLVLAAVRLGRRPTHGAALLAGVAVGVVFLCRWQDVVKAVVLVIPAVELWRRGLTARRGLALAGTAAAAAALVAGAQLHVWALERGEIFGLPQGSSYLRLAEPELGRFLFSGLSGLLPWSPIFALGLAGLVLPWRCRLPAAWRWVALGLLVFDIYLNASVSDWWGGASYGARRMASDVPFLALGVANLARLPRARAPLALLLAACCLWGAVTSNLFAHGLRDLALVVAGRPSDAPGAEREGGVQPLVDEARELALRAPFRLLVGNYFPRAGPATGRLLTVLVMALLMLLVAWGLARWRPARLLTATLVACLAIVFFTHARLLASGPGDAAERSEWRRLARAARGRPAYAAAAERDVQRLLADRGDGLADARRLLWIFALHKQGRGAETAELVGGLAQRGYLFAERLPLLLTMGPDDRMLLAAPGPLFTVQGKQGTRALASGRDVDLSREAVRVGLLLELGEVSAAPRQLLAWGRRGGESLARLVTLGQDGLALETPAGRAEATLEWRPGQSYAIEIDWLPAAGRIDLAVASAGEDPVRLSAPAPPVARGDGHLEVTLGAPATAGGYRSPLGARYSALTVSAGPEPPQLTPEQVRRRANRPKRRRLRGPNRKPPPNR